MNNTVLITGVRRGLGHKMAKHFLQQGWRVIGLAKGSDVPFLGEINYVHKQVDLRDRESIIRAFNELNNEKINLLINNAAVFTIASLNDITFDTIEDIIDTNVKGNIYVTKCALDLMSRDSAIVFINSVAGLVELENQSVYCASKYALTAFAGVVGKELRPRKIKVSSIHPGGINTTLWNKENPYPCGSVEDAIDPQEIIRLIEFIHSAPVEIDYKTIKLFPTVEWH